MSNDKEDEEEEDAFQIGLAEGFASKIIAGRKAVIEANIKHQQQ